MIDSHAHLYFERFDADREEVIRRARDAGIDGVINIGTDAATSRAAIELALRHPGFHAAIGLHPTSPVENLDGALAELRTLAAEYGPGARTPAAVVAIGEIGLDFHWKEVPPEAQRPKLREQLRLARELGLPVVFHCRDALEELFEVLESEERLPPGVFHCFSGGPDEVRRAIGLGFHVSFAGNVTYPKAKDLQAAAAAAPPERMLLETDAPFLAPQARRGQRNEPAFLVHTRDFLAGIHGLDPAQFGETAAAATRRLFGLG
jgi:TatD DNase family protein